MRLFIVLLLFSWAMVACFITFQYFREKQIKVENINALLQVNNTRILEAIENGGVDMSKINVDDFRITVIDLKGNILYDNAFDSTTISDNHLVRPEIAEALETGTGYTVRRLSQTIDAPYFYSATKGEKYIVRSAVPYNHSLQQILATDGTFLWIMLGITLVFSIIGYFVTLGLGVVVKRLNDFAARAERGERIYADLAFPNNELGSISSHIVRLYSQLQEAILERDRQHKLALFEQQEKIRIKRQLTNNINHELKTPVAAIQVCLETILEHPELDSAKRDEFIRRCYENSQRLKSLLNDISLITRMEDGAHAIETHDLDLSAVVNEAIHDVKMTRKEMPMQINAQFASNLRMKGNEAILQSVFRNLLDNALAYSSGKNITINITDKGDHYTVLFCDDGVGVEPEHIPHLFERFYRIDKGRSRKLGGTGLGLSIVKNAIILHGGTIEARNGRNGGLEFRFTLLKAANSNGTISD